MSQDSNSVTGAQGPVDHVASPKPNQSEQLPVFQPFSSLALEHQRETAISPSLNSAATSLPGSIKPTVPVQDPQPSALTRDNLFSPRIPISSPVKPVAREPLLAEATVKSPATPTRPSPKSHTAPSASLPSSPHCAAFGTRTPKKIAQKWSTSPFSSPKARLAAQPEVQSWSGPFNQGQLGSDGIDGHVFEGSLIQSWTSSEASQRQSRYACMSSF